MNDSQATLLFSSVLNDTTITLCTAETFAMTTELTTVNVDSEGQVSTACATSMAYTTRYGRRKVSKDFSARRSWILVTWWSIQWEPSD